MPCGHCYQCVRRRKSDWLVRLKCALNWSDCAFFKLLTFDDDHYPDDISREAQHREIKKFLDRLRVTLRRKFGCHIELKYFIASEMGELHDRLHYHCCFFVKGFKFGWQEFNEICRRAWNKGIVGNAYPLTVKNIRYCVKYIQKSYNYKWYSQFRVKDIAPEFFDTMSRFKKKGYRELPFIVIGGAKLPFPSYWLRLWFDHEDPKIVTPDGDTYRIQQEKYDYIRACNEYRDLHMLTDNDYALYHRLQSNFENREAVGIDYYKPVFINNLDIKPDGSF